MINLIPSLGHPSVAVVIYNKESDKLVLVKQLRPAVLFTELMNDASITSVNDMVKANDALKGNDIYFCSLNQFQAYVLCHCQCIGAKYSTCTIVQRIIYNNFLLMIGTYYCLKYTQHCTLQIYLLTLWKEELRWSFVLVLLTKKGSLWQKLQPKKVGHQLDFMTLIRFFQKMKCLRFILGYMYPSIL